MTAPIRLAPVALSAPALAHQWARQDNGPHGGAVIAHREIAARSRGGVEWTEAEAVAVSVIGRPSNLPPAAAEVVWLATGLAGADTIKKLAPPGTGAPLLEWPDRLGLDVGRGDGGDGGDAAPFATIGLLADAVLGPGRVAYVVLTVRFGLTAGSDEAIRSATADQAVDDLRRWTDQLDDTAAVVDAYRARCATLGQTVAAHRSPHGSVRGVAHDVTETGALILRSPTGLEEVVNVATTKSLEPLGAD